VSTLKLIDTLEEQVLVEQLIDESKPAVPRECSHLHYFLSTPFRYGAPYPTGSRFRRAGLEGHERRAADMRRVPFARAARTANLAAPSRPRRRLGDL
jgi:hypothetical protein